MRKNVVSPAEKDAALKRLRAVIGAKAVRLLRKDKATLKVWRMTCPPSWSVEGPRGAQYWHSAGQLLRPNLRLFDLFKNSAEEVPSKFRLRRPRESKYRLKPIYCSRQQKEKTMYNDEFRLTPTRRKLLKILSDGKWHRKFQNIGIQTINLMVDQGYVRLRFFSVIPGFPVSRSKTSGFVEGKITPAGRKLFKQNSK